MGYDDDDDDDDDHNHDNDDEIENDSPNLDQRSPQVPKQGHRELPQKFRACAKSMDPLYNCTNRCPPVVSWFIISMNYRYKMI